MNTTDWQTHVAEIEAQLTRLYQEGSEAGFLIVTCGEAYVQFTAPQDGTMYCEAVSNAYLPKNKQLGADKLALLHEQGFVEGKVSENFSCDRSVVTASDLHPLAELAAWLFANVYALPANSKLSFELELQG